MKPKLPPEAFAAYLELGASRSYAAVARRFGVCRRTVASVGARERWSSRATAIDRRAFERAVRRAVRTAIAERLARHREFVANMSIPDGATALDILELAVEARERLAVFDVESAARLLDRAMERVGATPVDIAGGGG